MTIPSEDGYELTDEDYMNNVESIVTNDSTLDDTDVPSDDDPDTEEASDEDTDGILDEDDTQDDEDGDPSDEDEDPDESPLGDEEEGSESSEDGFDYGDIGKKVMGEFKANGRVMKMRSAEDAISLMQMGANYHKKMSTLKPAMKTLKLLEKNGLMTPEKINYLIDLSQNKPEAIAQLMRESNTDPMDIDLEENTDYTPEKREVLDVELQLDDVIEQVQQSPMAEKTFHLIGKEWDDQSKQFMAQNPSTIKAINEHMESGIYDQVAAAVEYERSLGNFTDVTDFDAYMQTGEYMEKNKLFTNSASASKQKKSTRGKANTSRNNNAVEQTRNSRKKAASGTRTSRKLAKAESDIFELSDEEFMKIDNINI